MSDKTKRLLEYDMIGMLKDFLSAFFIYLGIVIWIGLIQRTIPNIWGMMLFIGATLNITECMKDWQVQIRMYISMGMTRKEIFQVIFIRNMVLILLESLCAIAIRTGGYTTAFNGKIIVLYIFAFLFSYGWGQVTGVLLYQKRKSGRIFQILGGLWIGVSAFTAFYPNEEGVRSVLSGLNMGFMAVCGAVFLAVFAGGVFCSYKCIQEYSVF